MDVCRNHLWILLPALLLTAGSMLAAPPQPVTECGTIITEPGKYRLVQDLVDCPISGVEILSSDVTLDLRGYTVSCAHNGLRNGGVMAWGEPGAPVRNVKITNGQVTGCADGILVVFVEDSKIWKMTSWGNRYWEGASGTGITVWLSQNNVIMNNHTYGNDDAGIGTWESSGNLLRGNVASDNNVGIQMLGIAWDGFLWRDIPTGNTVRSNIAEQNDSDFSEVFL